MMSEKIKTGLIDVGGGMRDVYGAGVLDRCLDLGIRFDVCAGVSAGAANITSFLAGQRGRNYRFYTQYAFRREYMSLGNYLRTGNYLDLEYVYGTLTNRGGEDPLDYPKVASSGVEFVIVATDASNGRPRYYGLTDLRQDDYGPVKASGNVPMVNRPYRIGGVPLYDGGIADPIPLDACFSRGCGRAVLILTRPKDYRRSAKKDAAVAKWLKRRWPGCAEAMSARADTYNRALDRAAKMEKEGKLLILAPDDIGNMKTLTRDRQAVEALYQKGLRDAEALRAWFGPGMQPADG